jgi:hypothetical protein
VTGPAPLTCTCFIHFKKPFAELRPASRMNEPLLRPRGDQEDHRPDSSGTGDGRPELAQDTLQSFGKWGATFGLDDVEMNTVMPLPLVDAAFNVWENLCRTRHWIVGWLTTSTDEFILSTLPENKFRPERARFNSYSTAAKARR